MKFYIGGVNVGGGGICVLLFIRICRNWEIGIVEVNCNLF